MLFVLLLILLAVFLASSGSHLVFAPVFALVVFVGFWVLVIKGLIGFGRWLMMPPARPRFPNPPKFSPAPRLRPMGTRTCGDPRCGRVNLAEARYCAQCGRPLGQAA